MPKVSPRRSRISVLLTACVVSAWGCGVSAGDERKELIVWGAWRRRGIKAVFKVFEKEHPQWQLITTSATTAGRMDPQKLMCAIAGGSPPDTLVQDRFSVGEWAVRDAFIPLDDMIAQSLREQGWATEARDSIAAGKPSRARESLRKLIAALAAIGDTRQRRLAEEIDAALAKGRIDKQMLARADELVALCQGVDRGRYYRACWEEARFGASEATKRVYAVPNTTDDRALYYNEDILESVGGICVETDPRTGKPRAKPPANWAQLKEYAVKLSKWDENGNLVRLGFAPNYGNSWLYIYGWLNGGKFMSADGRTCTLTDKRIEGALQLMVDIYDSLGGWEKVEAFRSTFQGAEFDPFFTGKVAMKIDGNWFQNSIANFAPTLRFRVAPAPAPKGRESITWSGGFSWAIPAGAKNKRMAFEFIRFFMSDRMLKRDHVVEARYQASQGRSYVPHMAPVGEVNAWTHANLVRNNPDLPKRIHESFLVFADLMKVSKFRPVTPVGQRLWDEHVRAYERASGHVYEPAEALERGRQAVQDELSLIYDKEPAPRVNWLYPIFGITLLVVCIAAVIYFTRGRMKLLRAMARPEARAGYAFASPWLIGMVLLTAGPIVVSIIYSFCRYDVLHPAEYVGADNYRRLAADPLFWKSLGNTGFMLLGVPLGMAVGLGVAMLLNTKVRGMQIYRTVFYLPAVVPVVAASILWIWVLNPDNGLINTLLKMLGVRNPPLWLHSPSLLLGSKMAIMVMGLWSAGAGMVIWLAGLKGIPRHLYEAAEIDGAGRGRRFWHVTLPMLSPYIFFNLIMGIIGTFQIFAQAYIMTEGGPNDSTLFYAYYLFNNAFRYFKMGYASALAWILFLVILALTLIQLKLAPRWVHYEA